jgi:hypothetical protein
VDSQEVVPGSTLGKFAGISTNKPLAEMHFPRPSDPGIVSLCRSGIGVHCIDSRLLTTWDAVTGVIKMLLSGPVPIEGNSIIPL